MSSFLTPLATFTDLPGPYEYVNSATHFYRALRVYPQPVELLMSE